jgi:ABC-type antimicrobial peptide transport system permease subunit
MKIPFKYTLKNFKTRRLTTAITIVGVALVVFVFAAVLMMAHGIEKTMISTGSDENVIVLRKSASGEISSIIDGNTQNIIKTLPYIAKNANDTQIISTEPVVVINLDIIGGGMSNITVRGVSPTLFELRPQIKLIEGRMFHFGVRELIVGKSINERFTGAQIGSKVRFAGDYWDIVGIFSTEGTGYDSELMGDGLQLLSAFNRGSSVSTMTIRLDDPDNFDKFKAAFEADRRLQQFEPKREKEFFAEQSSGLASFIQILGIFITVIFSLGATIGATITMYSAVANRTVEIGTLRSLGFSRRSILIVFLFESLVISFIGGVLGVLLASVLQFFTISTLNFSSFSEITFSFAMSLDIIRNSLLFAIVMGIIGGFFPAIRAARMNIIGALRSV